MIDLPLSLPIMPRPLSTKEGWADFVTRREPTKPTALSPAEWKKMPPDERDRYNRARRAHHNSFGPVLTPTVNRVHRVLFERAATNLSGTPGARPGAVIDGYANLGKTTVLIHFGREYERVLRQQHGEKMEALVETEWHPVVYHTLTAQTSVKSLFGGIAEYYGALVPKRASTHELARIVVDCAQRCATSVFLIDDIHYLDMRHVGAVEVNNAMKYLANETSATFVYAGIGCSETGFLTEGKGKNKEQLGQTRGRLTYLPIEPFKADAEDATDWLRLVKAFENELVLLKGHEGMCTNLAGYLHQRTGGFVGSLSTLMRTGAARAIETGEERISRKLLDAIKLDHAAEIGYLDKRRRAKSAKRNKV